VLLGVPGLKLSRFVMDPCRTRVRLGLAFVRLGACGVASFLRSAVRCVFMRSRAGFPFKRTLLSRLSFADLIWLVHT
jgi:hypothetical protein